MKASELKTIIDQLDDDAEIMVGYKSKLLMMTSTKGFLVSEAADRSGQLYSQLILLMSHQI